MRELKFRAWNNEEKEMMKIYSLIDICVDNYSWTWCDNKNVVFMQYTGLKDKNGKEVYEGDILEIWNDIAGISLKATVEYLDNSFDLVEKWWTVQFLFDSLFNPWTDGKTWKTCSTWYVIWNIYENPELVFNKY